MLIDHSGRGGGTGRLTDLYSFHLSPSEINITGMSSTMGYFLPHSSQMSQQSPLLVNKPSFSFTQTGQRKISSSSKLTMVTPIFKHNC